MKILITGTAGFIGFHLAEKLIARGDEVLGLDSINDYYDINLKYSRLNISGIEKERIEYNKPVKSKAHPNYRFVQLNIEDKDKLDNLIKTEKIDKVCHLAAQAGVRYSLTNPQAYIDANIYGFLNILECCRHSEIEQLVYASSSSVYGINKNMPFSTNDNVDHPISLYAASKKSNELMAHTYSHLFNLPSAGLRFFTVYGPWGRPDMALFLFTKAILENKPIDIFNHGKMERDFTYIDDIVEGVTRIIDKPITGNKDWDSSAPEPASSIAPYRIYNIGNSSPVKLMDFIKALEDSLGITAEKNFLPMQPGDVPATYADVSGLAKDVDYKPSTSVNEGIKKFVEWYREYYSL